MSSYFRAASRFKAAALAGSRSPRTFTKKFAFEHDTKLKTSEYFGCNTFSFEMMEKNLAQKDILTLREYATSDAPLAIEVADKVANAVKEWALSRGATHYCHWFQPQTGTTAEKHDAFFSLDRRGLAVEKFTGKELIQSEPDASSFPSGGRRSTFEARGYTAWDASSPMFLMETESGTTLCIPSLFISYSGEALDNKTPLLKSIAAVSKNSVEALRLLGYGEAQFVNTSAGPEQEYFVVDEALYNLRPDLILAGRTLLGRTPPRGQQLEDHYFGSIKPRILSFMMEAEHELYRLGVPCKTRHNEVAPCQLELAPIFENANVAADHNQVVMEVLKSVGRRHKLAVLFHEKPFAGINGSGKHVNWSLADNAGHNLLEPGDQPLDNIRFLYFLTATLKAVCDHANLLRMAIASAGNDFRLGANEAPPAIISVFLGETLDEVLNSLEAGKTGQLTERVKEINLKLSKVPVIKRDNTDRNRTSPFAFTGNKFEFRAVGASASISLSLTYLNTAVADALSQMNKRLIAKSPSGSPKSEDILAVIQGVAAETKSVRFEGNGYSNEWHMEAEKRGLPNLRNTPQAIRVLKDPKVQALLTQVGIHNSDEIEARYNVTLERYLKIRMIELETLHEMISSSVYPAAQSQVLLTAKTLENIKTLNGNLPQTLEKDFKNLVELTTNLLTCRDKLAKFIADCNQGHDEFGIATKIAEEGVPLMTEVRKVSDELELIVDDQLWSLPKYRELLYLT